MLTWLGIATIATLLALILFRVTSVLVALILVPVAAAVVGGFGLQIGAFALDGLRSVMPVAVMLAFAVIYFGVMNDVGLFEPVIRTVTRAAGGNPAKIAAGTAVVAALAHLDGAGAATFMLVVPAMLPIYARAGMDPRVLTCTAGLAAGTMNMLPWGGPTARAAAALQVSTPTVFVPVVPAMVVGLATVFLFAALIGRQERRRIGWVPLGDGAPGPASPVLPRWRPDLRWYVNAALTLLTLVSLFAQWLPAPVTFVLSSAIALLVNYPDANLQRERLTAHGSGAMMMVTTLLAAGVFIGILGKSGMLGAMTSDLVRVLPGGVLRHAPVALGVVSMPLSLVFDPDSFYFGVLPVLANASQAAGASAIEVGRAAILGQMTTGFPVSPLTPSTFLLIGLAGVDLADHQRKTIPYAFAVTAVMTLAAVITGAIRF